MRILVAPRLQPFARITQGKRMSITYQTRLRGKPPTPRITCTVRTCGVSISQTFPKKEAAVSWGAKTKDSIIRSQQLGVPFDADAARLRGRKRTIAEITEDIRERQYLHKPDTDPRPRREWSLGRALRHYKATVTPRKKSHDREEIRIDAWMRREIAALRLDQVTAVDVQRHVNARIAEGLAAMTIRNEVFLLSALYRHAAKPPPPDPKPHSGWGLDGLDNPVGTVELPRPPAHRDRRLQNADAPGEPSEEDRMRDALRAGPDGKIMEMLFVLAVETGMRLSELLAVRPENIRREDGAWVFALGTSKNDDPRKVVLSTVGEAAVSMLVPIAKASGRALLPLGTTAVEYRWAKARRAAGVKGLKIHDLRHEGLSRMANKNLTLGELKAQSGHRTAQVLMRYLNARVVEVRRKLG